MSASAGISVPTAILLASGLIAAGIFFGLRAQAPAPPVVTVVPPTVVPPTVVPPTVVPPAPVATSELVVQQATEALAYQRTRLRDLCYRPAALAAGAPLSAVWTLNVTFDALGNQLARGVVEQRGTSTPDLTTCIGNETQPLRVPPPGRMIMVEIPLSFP
jgi:hypothetical protein